MAANYTSPMWAKWNARRRGYDEILLVDEKGHVAEGPTTNVFLVDRAGALVTPPEEHVLLGVTRRTILEIARHEGIPVKERFLHPGGSARGVRGLPDRHHRRRLAGGVRGRPARRWRGERAAAGSGGSRPG